jgi:Haem-binding domain
MRRRVVRSALLAVLVVFLAIQLVPVQRTNPPFDTGASLERSASVPANVKAIVDRSCKDCHSNETRWPGYGYVAPMSWLLVRDVEEGRDHLNFSEWGTLDADAQRDSLIEICRRVRRGEMPLKRYAWLHASARLTTDDVKVLCDWTADMRRSLRLN